mmetsp:Transcript_106919/g.190058  ORF Transcript_106919/g.190058 Transcript_106919/m.190058 type:complete len:256 (-) Transcript_106919:16-783(-)
MAASFGGPSWQRLPRQWRRVDSPGAQEMKVEVPERTLDLFDALDCDPLGWDYNTEMYLQENPDAKRTWKLEHGEQIFDACHEDAFSEERRWSRWTWGQRRNLVTVADYGDLVHTSREIPAKDVFFMHHSSLVTIVLDDDFGRDLFRRYYKEKHGMQVTDIDFWTRWPHLGVTWDLTEVHRLRRERWKQRVQKVVEAGKCAYEGDISATLLGLARAFARHREAELELPLSRIRGFLGTYDTHLQDSFCKKRPRCPY